MLPLIVILLLGEFCVLGARRHILLSSKCKNVSFLLKEEEV